MKLQLIGHEDRYAVEQLQLALFATEDTGEVISKLCRSKTWLTAVTTITREGKKSQGVRRLKASEETVRLRRRILQQSYYQAALPHLTQAPPWGALSGVRPTKITTKLLMEGGTVKEADALLKNEYYVNQERRALTLDCSASTVAAAKLLSGEDVSLYIGIPFCPTRCTYCSFVSRTVGRHTDLIEPYLKALLQEIRHTGTLMARSGKYIRSLYIGGGTPTTLSAQQLCVLLDAVRNSFDLSRCLEFTVEAGRPDTLDKEKLLAIRSHGADRISINPQTMENHVLRACGRPHKAEDVLRCYQQAVDVGFDAINMDLIAGLPEDSYEGFCQSLDQIISLSPSNITVHTLALKKGADLFASRRGLPSEETVANMVEYANMRLRAAGYKPYYLYRQKYMSGSLENVGWSKNGKDCLYNIYMMEELHTIVSLGGGGMNKVNFPDGSLQRFHNPKFPEQYIAQLDSVLEQKNTLFQLL